MLLLLLICTPSLITWEKVDVFIKRIKASVGKKHQSFQKKINTFYPTAKLKYIKNTLFFTLLFLTSFILVVI